MRASGGRVFETRIPFPLARQLAEPRWPDFWDFRTAEVGAYPFARSVLGAGADPKATQRALVLESAKLRAELIPDLGGRLFIRHLPSSKDLFFRAVDAQAIENSCGHARIPGGLAFEFVQPAGATLAPAIAWHSNDPATLSWALPHPSAELSVRFRLELVDEPLGVVVHIQVLNRSRKHLNVALRSRVELAVPADTQLHLGHGPATYFDLFTHPLSELKIGGHDLTRPAAFPFAGRVELEDRASLSLISNGLQLQHVVRCAALVGRGIEYRPRHGSMSDHDARMELTTSLGWPSMALAAGNAVEWSEAWFVDAPTILDRELPPHPFPIRSDWTPRVAISANHERVRELTQGADAAVPDLLAARAFLLDDEKDQSEMRRIAEARPDQILKLLLHAIEAGTWDRLSGLLFLLPEEDPLVVIVEAAAMLDESGAELAREHLYALDDAAAMAARPADPRFATHLDALVRTERSSAALPYLAALAMASEQRWAAALEWIENARLRGCEYSEARYVEALVRALLGRDLELATGLAARVEAEHSGERAPTLLYDVLLRLQRRDAERVALWERARRVHPEDDALREGLALAHFEAGASQTCLAVLAEAAFVTPAANALRLALWCGANRRLARAAVAKDDRADTERCFRRAFTPPLGLGTPDLYAGPELFARVEFAHWLQSCGRVDDANAQLEQVRERLPKHDANADRLRSQIAEVLSGAPFDAGARQEERGPSWPTRIEGSPWH